MSLLLLVTGILVSIVFDRQRRRHRMELMWEYRRLNLPQPLPPPKLTFLQAWLNIVLGIILAVFGGMSLMMMLKGPAGPSNEWFSTSALFIGGGTTLIFLGIMALIERRNYTRATKYENIK